MISLKLHILKTNKFFSLINFTTSSKVNRKISALWAYFFFGCTSGALRAQPTMFGTFNFRGKNLEHFSSGEVFGIFFWGGDFFRGLAQQRSG